MIYPPNKLRSAIPLRHRPARPKPPYHSPPHYPADGSGVAHVPILPCGTIPAFSVDAGTRRIELYEA